MDGNAATPMSLRQSLEEAIRERAIITSDQTRIVSRRGGDSNWLIDLRRIALNPRHVSAIAELFWRDFAPAGSFQIGGMELSAVPMLSAIQVVGHRLGRDVNAFVVRKERKENGLGRRIEGEVTGDPVVVIDDIFNGGSSLEKVRAVLWALGKRIDAAFCVIDYHSQRGQDWQARYGLTVQSIFALSDFGLVQGDHKRPENRWNFEHIWDFGSPNPNLFEIAPRSAPVSDGERIYVGSDAGILWALNASTGEAVWNLQVEGAGPKGIRSTPAVHDGKVVFGAYDGGVYCIEASTGRPLWKFAGADWVGSSPAFAPAHGLLFIGLEHAKRDQQGGIAALDIATGAKRWELKVPEFVHGSPVVDAEQRWVACGCNGGTLWCQGIPSGRLLWSFNSGGPIKGTPVHDPERDLLIFGSFDGCIHVVDAKTGKGEWHVQTGGTIFSAPLLADGRAFIGSTDKHLYVLDLDGRKLEAKIRLVGKVFSPPRLLDDSIVVGSTSGDMVCIDRKTLAITDRLEFPERMVNAALPLPDLGLLVVPTADNRLYALKVQPLEKLTADELASEPGEAETPVSPLTLEQQISASYQEGAYFRFPAEEDGETEASRRLLGAAAMLWGRSADHRQVGLADFATRVERPLALGQARLFLKGLRPVGFISWAMLSKRAERDFLRTGRLANDDWRSGTRPWVIDLVAPEGGAEAMIAKVQKDLLGGAELRRRSEVLPVPAYASQIIPTPPRDDQPVPEGLRYIIATSQRTGGTLLCDALSGTGMAGMPDEWFISPGYRDDELKQRFGVRGDADYIDQIIRGTATPNGVFGVKMIWPYWDGLIPRIAAKAGFVGDDPIREVLPDLLNAGLGSPLKYIWLRRRNQVAQAISLYRAEHTGVWRNVAGRGDKDGLGDREPPFDADKIKAVQQRLADEDAKWMAYFQTYRIAPLMLFYEDFVENYEGTVRGVLKYLGLRWEDVCIAPPKLERQADTKSAEWVGMVSNSNGKYN